MKQIGVGICFGLIYVLVSFPIVIFLDAIGVKLPLILQHASFIEFFGAVIIAPASEEFIFRFLPIRITQRVTSDKRVLWCIIILVSTVFGYVHGSIYNIFLQGVGGVIYSVAFLRGGFAASATAHTTTNGIMFTLILIRG